MDGINHDGGGNATIRIGADDVAELYGRCTGIAPMRDSAASDPVWGLDEGDAHSPAWNEATAFWCPTELTAQIVAAYEHAHGNRTFGMTAIDDGSDVYVVVSSRR